MRILAQVVAVQPLALFVSMPNQLSGHIPITNVSSELTKALESMEEEQDLASDDDEDDQHAQAPDLSEIFEPGQYVRCIVTAVHAAGSTDLKLSSGRMKDGLERASRRVELSLVPEQVNEGVAKADLKPGLVGLIFKRQYDINDNVFIRPCLRRSKVWKTTDTS